MGTGATGRKRSSHCHKEGAGAAGYEARLEAAEKPAALAIAVLDVKQPSDWKGDPDVTEHWCLAHYLLDGHHKMFAAARTARPVTMLSFLALGESIAGWQPEVSVGIALDALVSA